MAKPSIFAKLKKLDSSFKGAVKAPAKQARGAEPKTLDDVKSGIVERTQEQAECLRSGNWTKSVEVSKNEGGKRVTKKQEKKVRPWHSLDSSGNYYLSLRLGTEYVYLEGSKSDKSEPTFGPFTSKDSAIKAYQTVIDGLNDGELDSQVQHAWNEIKKRLGGRKKKAA